MIARGHGIQEARPSIVIRFATGVAHRFSIVSVAIHLSKAVDMLAKSIRTLLFGITPALALVLFSPIGLGMVPWNPGINPLTWLHFVLPLPFYLGILAGPGYLYCAYRLPSARTSSTVARNWIRISLLLGIISSLAGMLGTYWMFAFLVPSLPSLGLSSWLLWKFEHARPGAI